MLVCGVYTCLMLLVTYVVDLTRKGRNEYVLDKTSNSTEKHTFAECSLRIFEFEESRIFLYNAV
jgi:hypothetical protein